MPFRCEWHQGPFMLSLCMSIHLQGMICYHLLLTACAICSPGYYQTWIYHMFETMMASQQQMLQHFSKAKK